MSNGDYDTPKTTKRHHTDHLAFFDDPVIIQRYDQVRHNWVEKFNDTQLSFFWRPEEVNITKDKQDFESLPDAAKFIFTSNLQRQILLDTVQGREPLKAFLPIASSPEMEAACTIWSFSELIHSRSYTHIIRGIYNNPSEVFDEILEIPEITDLHEELDKYYKNLEEWNFKKEALEKGFNLGYDQREHKKAAYLALVSVNALEAVRFYVSFACSFAMMELLGKMEGNSKIIKLISRDEALHLTLTQRILNRVIKEDSEWASVAEECKEEGLHLFLKVAEQEKDWADYLFQKGSILGLNANICKDYVDWITSKRVGAVGYEYPYEAPKSNPLPWMDGWLSSAAKQTALQEAENDSYLLGAVTGDTDTARTLMEEINDMMEAR
jgi:ribonucleoside-diphosphate reductase beta chain